MPNSLYQWAGQKPPRGAFLDPSHPFARDLYLAVLANEGGGYATLDLSRFRHNVAVPGSSAIPTWGGGQGGPALDFSGGGKELRYAPRSNYFTNIQNAFSVFALAQPTANQTTLWSVGEQTDSNDAQALSISTAGNVAVGDAGGSSGPFATSSLAVSLNVWSAVGVSQTASNARTFLLNGATQTNATAIGSSAIGAGQPMSLGRKYENAAVKAPDDFTGKIALLLVWKAGVSVTWLQALWQNPWQLFVWPSTRRYFVNTLSPAADPFPAWQARRLAYEEAEEEFTY